MPPTRLYYFITQGPYKWKNTVFRANAHPTNPKVTACQTTVFLVRFAVSVIVMYKETHPEHSYDVRPLFLCQPHEVRKNMPWYVFAHSILRGVAVTQPISPADSSKNPPIGVAPLESPQRARHDSGSRFPQRARTREERDVHFLTLESHREPTSIASFSNNGKTGRQVEMIGGSI